MQGVLGPSSRRVSLTIAACRVWRLKELVGLVNQWFGRFYKLVGLTIHPYPSPVGEDRVQAVMVWEIPPSQAWKTNLSIHRDAIHPKDLWRCEDLWVYDWVPPQTQTV